MAIKHRKHQAGHTSFSKKNNRKARNSNRLATNSSIAMGWEQEAFDHPCIGADPMVAPEEDEGETQYGDIPERVIRNDRWASFLDGNVG
jgi:hypothetical protein